MPSRDGDTNRVAAVFVAGILALLWADPVFASDVTRAQICGGGPGLFEALIVAFLDWLKRDKAPSRQREPKLTMPRVEPTLAVPAVEPPAAPAPEPAVEAPPVEPVKAQRRPRMTLDAWARQYIETQDSEITAAMAYAIYCEDCRVRRRKIVPRLEFGRALENAALALGRQRIKRAGRLSYAA